MTPSMMRSCLFLLLWLVSSVRCLMPWTKLWSRQSVLQTVASTSINETSVHLHFMNLALLQAQEAGLKGEVPIGALIVQRRENGDSIILSAAHNLVETHHDASSHAELLALRQAAKKIKNWRLLNTTLYTTLEPCPMCLSAAQAFRVSKIVYGAPDLRLGAIDTHIRLLDVRHPIHNIDDVIPGILQDESASLMRSFFRQRRQATARTVTKSGWWWRVKRKLMGPKP